MSVLPRTLVRLAVGAPILLLVLYALGGLSSGGVPGLPVVPLATLLALPLDVWVRDLAAALTIGSVLVGGVLAPQPSPQLRRIALVGAGIWLLALAVQAVLTVSEILALSWPEAVDRDVALALLDRTDLGRVLLGQAVLIAVAVVLIALGRRGPLAGAAAVLLLGAACLPGLTGHGGLDHGHTAATVSLGLHMVAASVWVGGLVAVAVYLADGSPAPAIVLRRYSVLALVSVVLVAESGLANASLRLDGVASLLTSPYGAIVLAKATLLIVLIGWGWRHRRALADTWPDPGAGPARAVFLRWVLWEAVWMGAVYGLAVALSRTAPPGLAIAGDRVTAGAIVILLLGVPLALVFVQPRLLRAPGVLVRFPEVAAVLALLAVVVVGTTLPSALAGQAIQLAALVAGILLVLAGWVLVAVLRERPAPVAAALAMIGLPFALWWIERDAPGGLGAGTWLSAALGVGMIAWAAFGAHRGQGDPGDAGPHREQQDEGVRA